MIARPPAARSCAGALGAQVAFVAVPPALREYACNAARDFHATQAASHYSDQVDTARVPRRFAKLQCEWVPGDEVLLPLGFRSPRRDANAHLVLTTGVDPHVDDFLGPTLLWTLHNDGLDFWQRGGARRAPPAGDVLIFDDRVPHSMDLTRSQQKDRRFDAAVWIGWAVPIAAL